VPLDVAALRAGSRARAAARPDGPKLFAVTDAVVPSTPFVRARHYRPVAEQRPLLVFLHGGMWVLGDLDSHDGLCRRIAHGAGVEVVAVDYRRAPEHPWPAAIDDATAAIRWAAGGLGGARTPGPVAVGGDSAGGCIAALAALALRGDPAVELTAQLLICPNTDLTAIEDPVIRAAAHAWMPKAARLADGDVSPLHTRDLRGAAPAIVITAADDALRAEGDAYAERLRAAGVAVTHRCEPGLSHGFVQGTDPNDVAATDRVIADVARALLPSHDRRGAGDEQLA
jgi:acetyl esterase/lipase